MRRTLTLPALFAAACGAGSSDPLVDAGALSPDAASMTQDGGGRAEDSGRADAGAPDAAPHPLNLCSMQCLAGTSGCTGLAFCGDRLPDHDDPDPAPDLLAAAACWEDAGDCLEASYGRRATCQESRCGDPAGAGSTRCEGRCLGAYYRCLGAAAAATSTSADWRRDLGPLQDACHANECDCLRQCALHC